MKPNSWCHKFPLPANVRKQTSHLLPLLLSLAVGFSFQLLLHPSKRYQDTFKMEKTDATMTPSPQPDVSRNRLPTLFEVLSRRTLPPVDLFSFYIYMRDQQRSVDYLDFWCVLISDLAGCVGANYAQVGCRSAHVIMPPLRTRTATIRAYWDPRSG